MSDFRDLFDIPDDVAWLNTAYMGALPRVAAEAARRAADRKARPWEITAPDFFDECEDVRAKAARLFGADADGVAIAPSVSYAIALAAKNVPVGPGGEIIVLADQFPSNVYAWRELEAEGSRLTTLTRSHNETWTDVVLDAIGPDTRLVAAPQVHWIDGGVLDLAAIGARAREHDAALVLDLTQSLGAAPFDAQAVDPDFAVAATYKWLLGPYTMAFLYAAPRQREGRPLEHTWMVRRGAEDFAALTRYQDAYAAGARRFDMGEKSNFSTMPVANASLSLLLDIGVETIAAELGARNAALLERLAPLGFTAEPAERRAPHYLGVTAPEGLPEDVLERLAAEKIYISRRGPRLRITPHLNASDADFDRLVEALARLLA
jgi:selenocysteine lyase/cysteine desulfurase